MKGPTNRGILAPNITKEQVSQGIHDCWLASPLQVFPTFSTGHALHLLQKRKKALAERV